MFFFLKNSFLFRFEQGTITTRQYKVISLSTGTVWIIQEKKKKEANVIL